VSPAAPDGAGRLSAAPGPSVRAVRAEHHRLPVGIGETRPRISWEVAAPPGWRQARYELRVRTADGTEQAHRVASPDSVLVPWPGHPLASRESVQVAVRVRGYDEAASAWSEDLTIEAGLLSPSDWAAAAITPAWPEEPPPSRRPPLLRSSFDVRPGLARARLYVTAHGLFEIEVNGKKVGDDALAPGWTSYRHRLRYYTYDLTGYLSEGPNAIGAMLADGWYRGRLGFHGGLSDFYGDRLALLAQVELTFADGAREVIVTDEGWRAAPGPVLSAGLYDGEVYDSSAELPGWSSPGYDDSAWHRVRLVSLDPATLVAPTGPAVRCTEELAPARHWMTPSGSVIVDFGQNLAGRLRIRVAGQPGQRVRIQHAEVLQEGRLYTRPLRTADATDEYLIGRPGLQTWEPRFTLHGFRFAEIEGWPGTFAPEDVTARVYHTDMAPSGWFTCSNELVNRLHENIRWSMRGNFIDLPTDCPQRDERLGWTGDVQIFAPAACFLYDCAGMLASWLRDLACEQEPTGAVPWYVPYIPAPGWVPPDSGGGWGDAAVLLPWALYQHFGDEDILTAQYDSARAWVEYVEKMAGPSRIWRSGTQLGDWLDPAAPPDDPAQGTTDPSLAATAYFALSSHRLSEIAQVLGLEADADRFGLLAKDVRQAFLRMYVGTDGRLAHESQTGYAMALTFGLVTDPGLRETMAERLAALVSEAGNRIATGFLGTPLICDALTAGGYAETAYALLLQTQCPSWLYPVTQGATTTWERWDSLLPDGTANPGRMTSFNHYALGAVADWLHRSVVGLAPAEPGYRTLAVRPVPGPGLTWAAARHQTPYGIAEVSWRLEGELMRIRLTVPHGTTALVQLPGQAEFRTGPGQHEFVA
jgi:alpha-L-rhamnosidase